MKRAALAGSLVAILGLLLLGGCATGNASSSGGPSKAPSSAGRTSRPERRRTFTTLSALGAKPRQLGAFSWSEGLLILVGGSMIGVALGFGVAQMLVKVPTGVFDPPPEALSVPWAYLALLALAAAASTAIAALGAQIVSSRSKAEDLRDF